MERRKARVRVGFNIAFRCILGMSLSSITYDEEDGGGGGGEGEGFEGDLSLVLGFMDDES